MPSLFILIRQDYSWPRFTRKPGGTAWHAAEVEWFRGRQDGRGEEAHTRNLSHAHKHMYINIHKKFICIFISKCRYITAVTDPPHLPNLSLQCEERDESLQEYNSENLINTHTPTQKPSADQEGEQITLPVFNSIWLISCVINCVQSQDGAPTVKISCSRRCDSSLLASS